MVKAIVEAPTSHTLVSGLRQLLLGEDPLEISRLWHKMYQGTLYYGREGEVIRAMAGIDLALWDIKGKALGQPVYKLLGGGYRKKLRAYASNMFQFGAEATADRAGAARDQGYTAVKFGWEPFGQNPAEEKAREMRCHGSWLETSSLDAMRSMAASAMRRSPTGATSSLLAIAAGS